MSSGSRQVLKHLTWECQQLGGMFLEKSFSAGTTSNRAPKTEITKAWVVASLP